MRQRAGPGFAHSKECEGVLLTADVYHMVAYVNNEFVTGKLRKCGLVSAKNATGFSVQSFGIQAED